MAEIWLRVDRVHPSPLLLPGQHGHRRRPSAVRRRMGGQDRAVPGDPDRGRTRCAGDGRQRPLPPVVAGQHAAVPGREGALVRRQLVQRGTRIRPAPDASCRGEEDLAAHILRDGLDRDFDLAFSNELRIDHSVTCPIITLRPQADLPIVPVYTNIFAPPLPQPKRFVQLGQALREMVESWDSDQRVAIIGTGHLSLELGGPRQFGEHGPDPEFDRKAVEWIASGDIDGLPGRGHPGQPARAPATPPTGSWTSC